MTNTLESNIKGLYKLQEFRNRAGMELYKGGYVSLYNNRIFKVHSATEPDKYYEVNAELEMCSCPDFYKRGRLLKCKHMKAVEYFITRPVTE